MSTKSARANPVRADGGKIIELFDIPGSPRRAATRKERQVGELLSCLSSVAANNGSSLANFKTGLPTRKVARELRSLAEEGFLIAKRGKGRAVNYWIAAKGAIALMAYEEFKTFPSVEPFLTNPVNRRDGLAFALLVIGHSGPGAQADLGDLLAEYAATGHRIVGRDRERTAQELLRFYRDRLESETDSLPQYLEVFKEFTTGGFQGVVQMLLASLKPASYDYNWLVHFFHEVVGFYDSPVRRAYVNLLGSEPRLRARLENYRERQRSAVSSKQSGMEVQFQVPAGGEVERFADMPPHLRAIALKLVAEPLWFMTRELDWLFWERN